jgi:hypothetical protein
LTKPNTSCTIEMPASLRSDGVRDHPGMAFGFIPDSAFGFAGIPTKWEANPLAAKGGLHDQIRNQIQRRPMVTSLLGRLR